MLLDVKGISDKEETLFIEDESGVMALGYIVDKIVYEGKTKNGQEILIFDSRAFGRTLVIDGMVQNSVNTEFVYNEMMTHMALDCQRSPKTVLIIGGGSGLTARQVLMYDCVKRVVLCDISDEVISLCRECFPAYYTDSLSDRRLEVVVGDGFEYVDQESNMDAILVDCCDPIGCADVLYSDLFYEKCIRALSDTGILCVQTGVPLFSAGKQEYRHLHKYLSTRTDICYKDVIFTCPMIVGGFYAFTLVTRNKKTRFEKSYHMNEHIDELGYYCPWLRMDYFHIPTFIRKGLDW